MNCYVYLIRSGNKSDAPIKIGMANDPQTRIAELQVGNPKELKIVATIPCKDRLQARHMEAYLHGKLSVINIRGEWFKSTGGDINRVLKDMSDHSGIFDYNKTTRTKGISDTKSSQIRNLRGKNKNLNKMVDELSDKRKQDKAKITSMRGELNRLGLSWREIDDL